MKRLSEMLSKIQLRMWAGLSLCLISSTVWAQAACEAHSAESRQVLSGIMTRADFETYRKVPFTVPSGTQAIHVQFDYDRA